MFTTVRIHVILKYVKEAVITSTLFEQHLRCIVPSTGPKKETNLLGKLWPTTLSNASGFRVLDCGFRVEGVLRNVKLVIE